MAAHSVQSALSTRDCRWPGCPDDGIHDEPGGPLCERHWRLQTTGSPLPPPARCDECRALLTGAHSEACSSYVEIRKPPTPEVKVTTLTRCKRIDCTEAATEHSLTVRSNRYRQLCQAHYDAERAKSIRPQRNGAPVPPVVPDPDPPIDPPDAERPRLDLAGKGRDLPIVECARHDQHPAHAYHDAGVEGEEALREAWCPGLNADGTAPYDPARPGYEREAIAPRVMRAAAEPRIEARDLAELIEPEPEPGPIGGAYERAQDVAIEGTLVTTLEASEWTPASRIRSAYVGAIEDAFAALAQELTSAETHYAPASLLAAIGDLLDLADKVAAAIDAVADEVPSAG